MSNLELENRKSEKGFTLVELAIVMIIIGLLITGILKGQEMIGNAQVTATVSQVKGIEAAVSTFRDMYDTLPGDITNPAVRLPNCAGTCNQGGNGDGRVGTLLPGVGQAHASENRAFFTHLAAADLISGVSITPDATALTFDEDLPATEVGGGFTLGFSGTGAGTQLLGTPNLRGGHYLSIVTDATANVTNTAGAQALTASQAARIDRKLDDGAPTEGSVRAAGATECIVAPDYNEALDATNCTLYIRIQG